MSQNLRIVFFKRLFEKHPNLPYSVFFVLLGVVLSFVIVLTRSRPLEGRPPFTHMDQDCIRGVIAACAALGIIAFILFRRFVSPLLQTRLRPVFIAGALALTAFAGAHYFYFTRAFADDHYLNFHDLYHYFLGCKYYPEAGYFELYNCHLKADAESKTGTFRDEMPIRDLYTYRMIPAKEARRQANCDRFDKERWREFKKDTAFFSDHMLPTTLADHGYNGTPFFAVVGGLIARLADASYKNLVLLTLLDLWALCILFAAAAWAFGPKFGLLFALFHFVNFGDYYYHVSFLRYWWQAVLGIGIIFLYKRRYGKAAVFLVVSAMLNVFPILFIAGIGLKILHTLIFKRSLPSHYRTFIKWTIIASVACGGLSLLQHRPIDRYEAFFIKQARHSNLITSTRTGFLYNFMFRPAFVPDKAVSLPNLGLNKTYDRAKIPRIFLTTAILLLFAWLVTRLDDFQAAIVGGFALLFMLFSTVVYYYAFVSLLLFLWKGGGVRREILWVPSLFFALMSTVFAFWCATSNRAFADNTVLSAAFTIYLAVTFIVLSIRTGLFEKRAADESSV